MVRLRDRILALGGIQAANSYVKVNLSLFDLYPRQYCPSIPPEVVLLPFDFLYQMSSWTRAIVVSLAIVHAANPRRPVPAGFNLDEIWLPGVSPAFRKDARWFTWHNFFLDYRLAPEVVGAQRQHSAVRPPQGRRQGPRVDAGAHAALRRAGRHLPAHDVLHHGARRRWAMRRTIPLRVEALRQFDDLMVDDGDRFFFQPCFSPVWDTAIGAYALGAERSQASRRCGTAADWLLAHEVRRKGDWSVKRPNTEPSGWAFFYNNEHYPDIDDTAMVMLALSESVRVQPCRRSRPATSAGSTGCWPCSRATAAGPRSTPTTIGSS